MITATDALRLPSAQLTPEERAGADALEQIIDSHVRKHMQRGGDAVDTTETRAPVIAEVAWRLRKVGFQVQVLTLQESSSLNPSRPRHVGYKLVLAPSDEALQAAENRGAA